ncbi:MAG: hypothetical protein WC965_13845 [Thiohalomonadaceae bacterium]
MSTELAMVIVGALGVMGSVAGSLIVNRKTKALFEYRMDQMEVKLDRHNHFGERLKGVETGLTNVCERVDRLEGSKK